MPERKFHFRLALALGVLHPDFLKEVLSARQLKEWELYYVVEPFGETHYQTARICTTLAEINRNEKIKSTPFEIEDFMPKFGKQTEEDKMNHMKRQLTAMSGKFVKREDNQSG